MKMLKLIAILGLGGLVTACASMPDIASRNAPFEATAGALYQQTSQQQALNLQQTAVQTPMSMVVDQVNVTVPRTLSVTEANSYYPRADIVWRGEPMGDRYSQIKSIVETAAFNGTNEMAGDRPVVVDLQIVRFHSLSERARASVGGVHNMHFLMTVRDAETGSVLAPTREIEANLPAYGGNQAVQAERRGQTQKVRVTGYLAHVIRQELENPTPTKVVAAPAPRKTNDI